MIIKIPLFKFYIEKERNFKSVYIKCVVGFVPSITGKSTFAGWLQINRRIFYFRKSNKLFYSEYSGVGNKKYIHLFKKFIIGYCIKYDPK